MKLNTWIFRWTKNEKIHFFGCYCKLHFYPEWFLFLMDQVASVFPLLALSGTVAESAMVVLAYVCSNNSLVVLDVYVTSDETVVGFCKLC